MGKVIINRIIIVFCLICLLFVGCGSKTELAVSNTYYVATTGNDSNPGTLAQPWLTIQHAANMAVAGDTVNIEGGTYTSGQISFPHSGTPGYYITFQNYNNSTVDVVITDSNYVAVYTKGQSYLQIIGLNIIGANNYYGIDAYGGSNIVFQNLTVTNTKASGIYSENKCSYLTVNGCIVYGTNTATSEEMISITQTSNFEVKNCIVHNPGTTQRIGIAMKVGDSNGSCHNNTVYNTTDDGIYIDSRGATHDIQIYDNLIYNCLTSGIDVADESGSGSVTNINIYNNIIFGCNTAFSLYARTSDTYTNIYFINNTCYDNCSSAGYREIWFSGIPARTANCIIRNNIIVGNQNSNYPIFDENGAYNDGVLLVDHNLFYNSGGSWLTDAQAVLGANAVQTDPLLTNPTTNFDLQSGSPAIDAGSATNAPSTDHIGTSRPQGTGYDIGAFEYFGVTSVITASLSPFSITTTGAICNERCTSLGSLALVTGWGTNYGTSTSYSATASNIGSHPSVFSWSDILSDLTAATLYHYQAYATNSTGIVTGNDETFLTLPNAPTALFLTYGNAQVSFTWVNATGGNGTTIYTQIQYSTSYYPSTYSSGTTGIAWTTNTGGTVMNLTKGTIYYFSAFSKATNGSLTQYSADYAQIIATPRIANNTFYVSTTGSDSNLGTLTQPWLTIQHAANAAVAGDTVNIEAGTYTSIQLSFPHSGILGNYITFQNYNSGIVNIVINDNQYIGITTNAQNYLKFIGLRVAAPNNYYGIDVFQSNFITIQNCYFTNCKADGIYAENATYITVDGCEVTGVGAASSEEMISFSTVDHFEIKNCLVHDPGGTERIGIDMKSGTSNGSIHNNTVYNTDSNGIYVDARGAASNINIYDNLIYNCPRDAGIELNDENGAGSLTNIAVYNNIIFGCNSAFATGHTGTETYTNCWFINNTCYNNGGYYAYEIAISTLPAYLTNCIIRNNIIVETATSGIVAIYDPNNDFDSGELLIDYNLFYDSTGPWKDANLLGTNAVQGNPLFVNPTTDFSLQSGSPGIDAGSAVDSPSTDYIGTSRPQGPGYDIGAYEYNKNYYPGH